MKIKISPSVMCCRVEEYKPYLELFEKVGLDSVHFDVMDGKYVKNVMLGTTIYKDIKRLSSLPVDVHIMAWAPEEFIPYYDVQPGDRISFHPETTAQPYKLLQSIKERGCRAGLVLNPGTPLGYLEECVHLVDYVMLMTVNPGFAGQKLIPQGIDRIRDTRAYLEERGYGDLLIEVDGNVSWENIPKMAAAGTDIYVAGTSSLFNDKVPLDESVARFRSLI